MKKAILALLLVFALPAMAAAYVDLQATSASLLGYVWTSR